MNDMGAELPELNEAPASGSIEQCVPLASLGVPGEGEQMENPEVGDQVNFEVAGKVTRIEGDKAYVMPESINGQPVEETPEPDADDGEAGMGGLTDLANQTGFMGAILIAFMLLLANICSADRIADGKVAIVYTNGASQGGFESIAKAIAQAPAGSTVHVGPGIYAENNLAKDGITLVGDRGADIVYVQTTTNDAGYGLFDDRGKGAIRMAFDWPGRMIMISVTNVLLDNTNDLFHLTFSPNQLGVITSTNPGTQYRGHIGEVSGMNYLNANLYLLAQTYQSNSILHIDRMVDLGLDTQMDLAPIADPGNNMTGPNVWGWFCGKTFSFSELHCPYMAVTGQSWYWLEPDATAKTNDFYFYAGYVRGNMYGVALTPLYRWWTTGIELTGAGISGTIACYGGGKGYFDFQKIVNPGNTGGGVVYNAQAATGISNSSIYVRAMKMEGQTKFVDVSAGTTFLRVDEFLNTGAMLNGITNIAGSLVVPHYSVGGLTNVAAAASSLVVNVVPPMPGTNYTVSLTHKFNPVAIPSITVLNRSNFTITYSAGVTTGGGVLWHAKQNTQ